MANRRLFTIIALAFVILLGLAGLYLVSGIMIDKVTDHVTDGLKIALADPEVRKAVGDLLSSKEVKEGVRNLTDDLRAQANAKVNYALWIFASAIRDVYGYEFVPMADGDINKDNYIATIGGSITPSDYRWRPVRRATAATTGAASDDYGTGRASAGGDDDYGVPAGSDDSEY